MITRRTLTQSIVLFGAFCLACGGDSTPSDSDNAPDPDAGGEVGDDADLAPDAAVDAPFSDPLARGNSAPTLGDAGDRRAPVGVSTVIVLDARDPDGGRWSISRTVCRMARDFTKRLAYSCGSQPSPT